MHPSTIAAFTDELNHIDKLAFNPIQSVKGGLRFLQGGFKGLHKAVTKGGNSMSNKIRAAGPTQAGGLAPKARQGAMDHMRQIYRAGAGKATYGGAANVAKAGGNGTLGGLSALARSRYGQMAAAGGLAAGGAGLAGYGGYKALGGGSNN